MNQRRLFGEKEFFQHWQQMKQRMASEVRAENPNYLLNANEDDLVAHYISKYEYEPITLHWDQQTVSGREASIPAERFPGRGFEFNISFGRSYTKYVVTYDIPFTGNKELIDYQPRGGLNSAHGQVSANSISYEVVDFYGDSAKVTEEAGRARTRIEKLVESLNSDIQQYNRDIGQEIKNIVQHRKAECLKQANLLTSLGVPIKKTESTPQTFAVPTVKRKIVFQKPVAPTTAFKPEPTIPESVYNQILTLMHDLGNEMERRPALYKNQDEYGLRDNFVAVLNLGFDSATGETFNKGGKTDIFIKHEGKYAFVAECKFWSGKKKYFETIDQLFGYLTWRDSKAAVVMFVPNKELSGVLKTIEEETPKHSNFVKDKGKLKDGWYSYEFHLPDDKNRHVSVAVLAFHFPEAKSPAETKS